MDIVVFLRLLLLLIPVLSIDATAMATGIDGDDATMKGDDDNDDGNNGDGTTV